MIQPIVLYGDPTLNQPSAPVDKKMGGALKSMIEDMFETMHKANGAGLSAIQIGVPLRLFVIDAHLEEEDFHFRGVFINPKIIKEWGDPVKHPEGCLSIPGMAGMVERPSNIEIEWYDEDWKYQKEEFSGFRARVIQHEYDHLQGTIYIEKLDKMWLKAMEPSLQIIRNGEMEVPYLCK